MIMLAPMIVDSCKREEEEKDLILIVISLVLILLWIEPQSQQLMQCREIFDIPKGTFDLDAFDDEYVC